MKKIVFLASFVAVSINVFASPEGYRTDSSRFPLGMRDISGVQEIIQPQRLGKCKLEMRDIPETEVEKSSPSKNLRKRKRINYVQTDSWPQEKDDSQDLDYSPRVQRKRKKPIRNNGSIHFLENIVETEQLQKMDFSQPFSSPNKKLKLNLDKNYYDKKLNLINNKDFFKKYRNFDNVESLVLTVEDLKDANKFKFPNLKELNIDILIKQAKPKKIGTSKNRNLKQLVLEELFSKKNQRRLRNHRLEKECKDAAEKRRSRLNKKESINQLLFKGLPMLLLKNSNIEKFSIQHINCELFPSQIWNLEKVKSLTLKMLGMNKLSPEIGNLTNLEVLDLSNNKMKALPKEISRLKNLKELYLISNHLLEKFPNVIEQLPNLKVLNIDAKQEVLWEEDLQRLKEINKNLKIEVW